MKSLFAWCMLGAAVLAGCAGSDRPVGEETVEEPPRPDLVRFLAIGDQGTGDEHQLRVARAMEAVCIERGCDFVLGLGDNIYNDGAFDAYDRQFEEKFEKPYANFSIPFYMVLGNHDNGGGNGNSAMGGDNEVAYHYRTDRTSDKWQMPARWYTFQHGHAQFFALDSGPKNMNELPYYPPAVLDVVENSGEAQAAFLQEELPRSTATWKFTIHHHPYLSNGQHGTVGRYDGVEGRGMAWRDLLRDNACGQVDLMFAGHDHDLQWLEPTSQPLWDCGKTEFIVSGAGGKVRTIGDENNPTFFERYDGYGFFWVELDGDKFTGVVFDDDANVLYERSFTRVA